MHANAISNTFQNHNLIRRNISPFGEDTRRASMRNANFKNTQAYFGECRMLRIGFVFDEPLRTPTYSIKFHTQAYRSGHNEAVLKTVCLTGTGVRIPQPAPKNTNFSVGVFLFFVLNLCAVTMGRRAKTINNYFCEAETAQSNEPAESSLAQTIGGDYATVEGRQSQQSKELAKRVHRATINDYAT